MAVLLGSQSNRPKPGAKNRGSESQRVRCSGFCYDSENANLTFTPSFVLAFFPCSKYTQPQMHVLIAEGEVNTVEVP